MAVGGFAKLCIVPEIKASFTRIRFCLKTEIFSLRFGVPSTRIRLKTVIENASFEKRSPVWRFLKTPFCCTRACEWVRTEGSENNYVLMLETSYCACFHQRWYCLQQSSYIALSVEGQKRLKNATCERQLLKTDIRVNRAKILATTLNFGWILLQHTRITVALAGRNFSLFKSLKAITCNEGGNVTAICVCCK